MKFEIDLEAAVARALSPEVLMPVLDKHLQKALDSAIGDSFSWNSDFQKALKEQLNQLIPHGLQVDDIARFQHVLNARLTEYVGAANKKTVDTAIKYLQETVLKDLPAKIKITELMEEARSAFHKESHECFYAYLEGPDEHDYFTLYLHGDDTPGLNKYSSSYSSRRFDRRDARYSADFRLSCNKDGEVYSLKFEGKHLKPFDLPNAQGRFDAMLLALYTGRCSLDMEGMDDDDITSLAGEQEPD